MPVFSTVGEPAAAPSSRTGPGGWWCSAAPDVRRAGLGTGLPAPARSDAVRELWELEEILDVGRRRRSRRAGTGSAPSRFARSGLLPAAEVSALLLGVRRRVPRLPAGLPRPSPRSSPPTAPTALLPVCAWDRPRRTDGLRPAAWAALLETGRGDPQAIATAARAWYADHALARQAERFRAFQADVLGELVGMKILFYSPAFLPNVGGLELNVANLAAQHQRRRATRSWW